MIELINNIFAVVVTYFPSSEVKENISAILEQGVSVIVVDNGSNDISKLEIEKISKLRSVTVIRNEVNLGIAKAFNQGIRVAAAAGSEWVFTFDQDSRVVSGFVSMMIESYQSAEKEFGPVALLAPEYYDPVMNQVMGVQSDRNFDLELRQIAISSGNLLRVSIFETVGLFAETFFIDYVDVEFCLRVRKQYGYKIIQTRKTRLYHLLGNPEKIIFFGRTIIFYAHDHKRIYTMTRNRIILYKRYAFFDLNWFAFDLKALFSELIKVILFKKNLRKYFNSYFFGFFHAILNYSGPYKLREEKIYK